MDPQDRGHNGSRCRVVIVEADENVRSALHLIFRSLPGVQAESASLETLLDAAIHLRPEVVLLDWDLISPRHIQLVDDLKRVAPGAAIIALGTSLGQPGAATVASAFISKTSPPDQLLRLLRELLCDQEVGSGQA